RVQNQPQFSAQKTKPKAQSLHRRVSNALDVRHHHDHVVGVSTGLIGQSAAEVFGRDVRVAKPLFAGWGLACVWRTGALGRLSAGKSLELGGDCTWKPSRGLWQRIHCYWRLQGRVSTG